MCTARNALSDFPPPLPSSSALSAADDSKLRKACCRSVSCTDELASRLERVVEVACSMQIGGCPMRAPRRRLVGARGVRAPNSAACSRGGGSRQPRTLGMGQGERRLDRWPARGCGPLPPPSRPPGRRWPGGSPPTARCTVAPPRVHARKAVASSGESRSSVGGGVGPPPPCASAFAGCSRSSGGQRAEELAVDAAGAEQRRIDELWPVGCGEDKDPVE